MPCRDNTDRKYEPFPLTGMTAAGVSSIPMHGNELPASGDEPLASPERDLYPVPEVATRLAISERQVWRLIRDEQLAVVRLGGRTLVAPEAIAELKARLVAEAGDAA